MATSLEQKAKPKWGDADASDAYDALPAQEVHNEERPDGSIIRTITDYRTNAQGQRVKIVKKLHIHKIKQRINPAVEQRKQWRKFGECEGLPAGLERGVSTIGDEAVLEVTRKASDDDSSHASNKPQAATSLGIVCRNCKGDHWTHRCPYQGKLLASNTDMGAGGESGLEGLGSASSAQGLTGGSASSALGGAGGGAGKYVVPGQRAGGRTQGEMMSGPGGRRMGGGADETATVRVTNLSEETKESDLQELFRKFGPISRVYLAKDKVTNLSKGFAFINFMHRQDAARAIDQLSGKFGYDHLILHIEWAKPSSTDATTDRKRI